ncbi:MAG TPA: hypothetical protein VKR78_04040, partial [Acidimicrobiales bacterium]|nr:hypothetical protein [Acidimicrobiales bacterium]
MEGTAAVPGERVGHVAPISGASPPPGAPGELGATVRDRRLSRRVSAQLDLVEVLVAPEVEAL